MKAAVNSRYGSPDVVRIVDVPVPSLGPDDVLVAVRVTTVNRTDCAYRAASPFFVRTFTGLTRPRRTVLGTEFSGVVHAVGTGVTSFRGGQRVFGYNEGAFGTHAEYLSISADGGILGIPDGVGFDVAAAATEGAHYALAFIRVADVRAGQDVLVYGATGAIGSAAVQLLKALDARVTAVCDTANLELVAGLGADRVVDYTAEDFTRDDQRYEAVFDAVGKSTFWRCRRLLKPRGVYLSSDPGPGWQNIALALVSPLARRRGVRFPIPRQDAEVIGRIRDLLATGAFRPVIDRRYPLSKIVDAYRYVETGRKVGNVLIDVAS